MQSYSDLFEAVINLLVGLFAITMCGLSHLMNRIDDFSLPRPKPSSSSTTNMQRRVPRQAYQVPEDRFNNIRHQRRVPNIRYEEPETPPIPPVDEERVAASRRL